MALELKIAIFCNSDQTSKQRISHMNNPKHIYKHIFYASKSCGNLKYTYLLNTSRKKLPKIRDSHTISTFPVALDVKKFT